LLDAPELPISETAPSSKTAGVAVQVQPLASMQRFSALLPQLVFVAGENGFRPIANYFTDRQLLRYSGT
jgi:hypothetical protein